MAVRLGDARTRELYGFCLWAPFTIAAIVGLGGIGFCFPFPKGALIAVVAIPIAVIPWRKVTSGAVGPALIEVLGWTGRIQVMIYGLLLTIGIVATRVAKDCESGLRRVPNCRSPWLPPANHQSARIVRGLLVHKIVFSSLGVRCVG